MSAQNTITANNPPKPEEKIAADGGSSKSGGKRSRRKLLVWNADSFSLRVRKVYTSGWRLAVQLFFLLTSLYIGWRFVLFVHAAKSPGTAPLPPRPPGVEGYLPISGLMGALDWWYQGTLNIVHPAATILLLIFIGLSLVARKSFCGWICPVGFVSDNLARLGQVLFKRNFRLPGWLDVALRGIKYFLLGFFVWAIFGMGAEALRAFIESPYNKISDVKMLMFFVELSAFGAAVLIILAAASVFVQGFWCRYLCPYGALVGLFSWMSPLKVRRDPVTCISCDLCDKACPARLPVARLLTVKSPECIGCHDCVSSCPVPTALWMGTRRRRWRPSVIAAVIVGGFLFGYIAARVGGVWENQLSDAEIRRHVSRMNSAEYGHPGR